MISWILKEFFEFKKRFIRKKLLIGIFQTKVGNWNYLDKLTLSRYVYMKSSNGTNEITQNPDFLVKMFVAHSGWRRAAVRRLGSTPCQTRASSSPLFSWVFIGFYSFSLFSSSPLFSWVFIGFYRTQVYLGSDLWVRVSLNKQTNWRVCKLNWWRYQLNNN